MSNEVLKKIKENNKSLRLPKGIKFGINGKTLTLHLSEASVTANMQTDDAAFDAWALGIQHLLWKEVSFARVSWDKPKDVNDRHYQRFLYRVMKFTEFTKEYEFFSIDEASKKLLEDSKFKPGCLLNKQEKRKAPARLSKPDLSSENQIELHILTCQQKELERIVGKEFDVFDRQFPVGVFQGKIDKENAVFTGGKSAIDLWATSKDTCHVFELKKEVSPKAGILSELLFYMYIIQDFQRRHLTYKDKSHHPIQDTKRINGYFIVSNSKGLHPLISDGFIKRLNRYYASLGMKFGRITYDKNMKLELQQ